MKTAAVLAAIAIALGVSGLARPAAAAPTEDRAKATFSEGVELFERGDHRGALERFEKAYADAPYPVVLYNIGLAREALGDPVGAIAAMERVVAAPGNLRKARLERAAATIAEQSKKTGKLTLSLPVEGAVARIDDGEPLPLPIEGRRVKSGEVWIEVSAPGHRPVRRSVKVEAGATAAVTVELERAASLAHVKVSSLLPGAEVAIDGVVVGRTPLLSTLAVEPGSHRVEVRREGYMAAGESITIAAGGAAELSLTPREDVSRASTGGAARLTLLPTPSDASVIIDGTRRDLPPGGLELPPGVHAVRVERSGYDALEIRVDLARGERLEKRVALIATPEERARQKGSADAQITGGWAALGAGVALASAWGGVLGWNAGNKADLEQRATDLEERQGEFAGCSKPLPNGPCLDRALQLVSDQKVADGLDIGGGIAVGAGAVGAITGAVLLLTAPSGAGFERKRVDEWAAVPVVAPLPGGGFVGVSGMF